MQPDSAPSPGDTTSSRRLWSPCTPVPPPLTGAAEGTFAHHSVAVRLGNIAERTLEENELSPAATDAMRQLIDEVPHAGLRPLHDRAAPDADTWAAHLAPYLGRTWLEVPWFLTETYFYRRIAEAVDFFGTGIDPFRYQKRAGLAGAHDEIDRLAERLASVVEEPLTQEALASLLHAALWGNQADLSLWPAGEGDQPSHAEADAEAHLLVDAAPDATRYLLAERGGTLAMIADNAGYELVGDLAVVDAVLSGGAVDSVLLHLKLHPTFVSDALAYDVDATIDQLCLSASAATRAWGERLFAHRTTGRLRYRTPAYWTSPLSGWQLPQPLYDDLAAARLILSKGDANYRRWHGDRMWDPATPFEDIVCYTPAPLLALRTVKAELISGLTPGRADALDAEDADWMTNGRWGVIQFTEGCFAQVAS